MKSSTKQINAFVINRNRNQIDEMKRANEEKLDDLRQKRDEIQAVLKSHRHEMDVSSKWLALKWWHSIQ